jgi:gas vesicle protein
MNNKQFLIGMSAGLMVGSAAVASMGMKKRRKTGLGKALKSMAYVVDSVAGSFGK